MNESLIICKLYVYVILSVWKVGFLRGILKMRFVLLMDWWIGGLLDCWDK